MAKKSTSSDTPKWISLCDMIDDGKFDEGLNEIARTIQTRLDVRDSKRARRMIAELTEGTRVMISNRPTPRYLEGMAGSIMSLDVENQAARVELDELPSAGRGRPSATGPSKRIRIPLVNLVVLDDDEIAPSELDDADIGDDEEYDDDDDD